MNKELLFDMISIGMGLALFLLAIVMKLQGGYIAYELNPWVLDVEIILPIIVIGFGIERFTKDLK